MTPFQNDTISPFDWFNDWFLEAEKHEPRDHNAMALATAGASHMPSVRMVLLKEWSTDGFVFYTNAESHKGEDLAQNPNASLCFYWKSLSRQIRIDGSVSTVSAKQSDDYFRTRPRDAQIGAWASHQSRPMASMDELTNAIPKIERLYAGKPIPRPPYWQGYCLVPQRIEFWQEGLHRLHQRVLFTLTKSTTGEWTWIRTLLYP